MKQFWPAIMTVTGIILFFTNGVLSVNSSGYWETLHAILAWTSFAFILIGLAAGIFKRELGMVVRILSALGLLFVLGLCFVAYCYGIALRNNAIIVGKHELKSALKDYQERGYVTNYSSSSHVWLSSNVVNIAGQPYECFITVRSDRFLKEGTLSMTTNEVFIWFDTKRGPKLIKAGYRPPFFPPRF